MATSNRLCLVLSPLPRGRLVHILGVPGVGFWCDLGSGKEIHGALIFSSKRNRTDFKWSWEGRDERDKKREALCNIWGPEEVLSECQLHLKGGQGHFKVWCLWLLSLKSRTELWCLP